MSGVHLFVPMLHRHDAVGEHTRTLRDGLLASGVRSQIYTELPDPATVDETRHYLEYESASEPGDVLVYQFATESAIAPWLASRPEPVVINYHSITPPEYFGPWNNGITRARWPPSGSSPCCHRGGPGHRRLGVRRRGAPASRMQEDDGGAGGRRGRSARRTEPRGDGADPGRAPR